MSAASIGIVVIGRNEGARLVRCLASLPAGATVVYVDSGSRDDSIANARSAGVDVHELDLSVPFTAARARHQGVLALAASSRELQFVQFVDGDCTVAGSWVEEALCFLQAHEDVAVVCGRRREVHPDASVYNRLCDLEWNTPTGQADACGGDALVRLLAYNAVGGFDPALMAGEEPELCARLRGAGWKVWRIDAEMTEHDAAITRFGQWWMRAVRGGFGYAQVWRRTRHSQFPLYGRNLARAAFWGGIVPCAALLLLLIDWRLSVLVLGLLVLQVARIGARNALDTGVAWAAAFFTVLAKFPELQGALTYFWRSATTTHRSSIDYKS